jgi:hypothetical protein
MVDIPIVEEIKHKKAQMSTGKALKEHKKAQIPINNELSLELTHNKYQCQHCDKILSSQNILHRHITKYCNVIKENTKKGDDEKILLKELLEEMRIIKEENKELKEKVTKLEEKNTKPISKKVKQIQNTIASNNVNSNNTIIYNNNTIVAFDKEDFDSVISKNLCGQLIGRGINGVIELLKYTHFNKDLPQFHNCYISNSRGDKGLIYNGDDWHLIKTDEIIDKLIDKNSGYLEMKFDEFKDIINPTIRKKFESYLHEKQENEEKLMDQYKGDMKTILYNSRKLVSNARKETEKLKLLNEIQN